jgi:hypothetical protein
MAYTTIADAVKTLSKLDGMQSTLTVTALSITKIPIITKFLYENAGHPRHICMLFITNSLRPFFPQDVEGPSLVCLELVGEPEGMRHWAAILYVKHGGFDMFRPRDALG